MIPDHARMLENLNRTARTAGHDTILETWKLKRLLAAAGLAEAVIAHRDLRDLMDSRVRGSRSVSDELRSDSAEAARDERSALAAYRVARESEIR